MQNLHPKYKSVSAFQKFLRTYRNSYSSDAKTFNI